MEYVKIKLERWQELIDENRELQERFEALREGATITKKGYWSPYIITYEPLNEIIKDQFEQVHRDLRDNYFLPLINAATRKFKEKIKERFNQYHSIKEDISHSFSLKNEQKTEQKKKIQDIKYKLEKLSIDIASCTETGLT